MSRFAYPLLVLAICLPVALLALGVPVPGLDEPPGRPEPLAVPDGDRELAWLNTTTSWTSWERFVAGVVRAGQSIPGVQVDDTGAFRESTTEVPEVVVSMAGRPGRVRVRWYKLSSEATAGHWIDALAERTPAPLAVIGGGSTDRAVELATALNARDTWAGDRPLLFLTTATADESGGKDLLDLYPGRTFRFCFTNRQMAEAVLGFVLKNPELRARSLTDDALAAVASGLALGRPTMSPSRVFAVEWLDDPYSTDLHWQFKSLLNSRSEAGGEPVRVSSWAIPYSVGGLNRPNEYEARVAESILEMYRSLPPQRTLLIVPAVTAPARRLLATLSAAAPELGERMVAVTGDGISLNSVYRDGEYAWPVQSIPVPLVFFAHNNPVAWDEPGAGPAPRYALPPPTGTDEVLLFADLARLVFGAAFGRPDAPGLARSADELDARLRANCPDFFDDRGNRIAGTGEYVVVVRPDCHRGPPTPSADPRAVLDVWRRTDERKWALVRRVDIDQWQDGPPVGGVSDAP